jgi:hypothetical protein
MDFWLTDHFAEAMGNVEVENFTQTSTSIVDLVHINSEHPTYNFQVENLVALVSGDQDPFWLPESKTLKKIPCP